ncbi:uncharacterized protein LOC113563086 [Ooceraea biroi]|uniref:uncharacterized protein LOC113563086 n=1 Tax=Ooceraea biroi TaxID=2015173 RepID=UPI000F084417|nr:uncharacterized protein LOC113563086 [Ooceraea biroi]
MNKGTVQQVNINRNGGNNINMSIIFKRIILDDNNTVIENETHILCEVENETEESSSFDENDELHANTKNDEWSDETTRFILDKYADYLELVGPMKKFKNKKIATKDDSIEPEVLQSANKVVLNVKNTNVSESSNTLKNKKAKCNLLQTLIEIHKEEESKNQE